MHDIEELATAVAEPEVDYGDAETGNASVPLAGVNCDRFTFVLYVFVLGALCVFGLVGNTLAFLVLRSERRGHVATFLLQTMAVADNVFLTTSALSQMTMALTMYTETRMAAAVEASPMTEIDQRPLNDLYTVTAYVQVYVWPLVHISQMWTVWITVLVAFNRFVAICMPFQATQFCTMRQARTQVLASALAIIIYNIPRFLEHRLEFSNESWYDDNSNSSSVSPVVSNVTLLEPPAAVKTSLKDNIFYNIIYENVLYCLFVFLGPLVILIVLNTGLIRELYLAQRRLRERHLPASVIGPEQGEHSLTLVMIVIIVIFLVCQTPAFFNQVMFVIGVADSCGRPYYYYYHLSNIIVSANSAVNFVVYCVFRRQFRRRLREFCSCSERPDSRRESAGSLLEPWPPKMQVAGRSASITNARHSFNNHFVDNPKTALVKLPATRDSRPSARLQ